MLFVGKSIWSKWGLRSCTRYSYPRRCTKSHTGLSALKAELTFTDDATTCLYLSLSTSLGRSRLLGPRVRAFPLIARSLYCACIFPQPGGSKSTFPCKIPKGIPVERMNIPFVGAVDDSSTPTALAMGALA
ncbi:hypothetical protein VTO73DRAFT_13788 [Trametes versicolor]